MTIILGIRDFVRNIDILQKYDYVDIEDKKTHEYKGLFLSPTYAAEFKRYLESKAEKEKQEKLSRLKHYAAKGTIKSVYEGLSSKQMRAKIAQEKIDE